MPVRYNRATVLSVKFNVKTVDFFAYIYIYIRVDFLNTYHLQIRIYGNSNYNYYYWCGFIFNF